MSFAAWCAFLLGASIGAPLRYLVDLSVQSRLGTGRPYGTLIVNVVGSLLLGVVAGLARGGHLAPWAEIAIGTGFCGALTTFSTFAFETVRLAERGDAGAAIAHLGMNTAFAITLAAAGYAAASGLG